MPITFAIVSLLHKQAVCVDLFEAFHNPFQVRLFKREPGWLLLLINVADLGSFGIRVTRSEGAPPACAVVSVYKNQCLRLQAIKAYLGN